jgi:hypothetical protein
LFKRNNPDKEFNLNWFKNEDDILEILKHIIPRNRKTILSALVCIRKDSNTLYKKQMNADGEVSHTEDLEQKKNEKQKANWITQPEIATIYGDMCKAYKPLWNADLAKNMGDFQKQQNLVILALLGGLFIPPRRSLDYAEFKIRNVDDKTDNYLSKTTLYFNKYNSFTVDLDGKNAKKRYSVAFG